MVLFVVVRDEHPSKFKISMLILSVSFTFITITDPISLVDLVLYNVIQNKYIYYAVQ